MKGDLAKSIAENEDMKKAMEKSPEDFLRFNADQEHWRSKFPKPDNPICHAIPPSVWSRIGQALSDFGSRDGDGRHCSFLGRLSILS